MLLEEHLPETGQQSRTRETMIRALPAPACRCAWQRLARRRWLDHLLSWVGWYPWQCRRCHKRAYVRFRFWAPPCSRRARATSKTHVSSFDHLLGPLFSENGVCLHHRLYTRYRAGMEGTWTPLAVSAIKSHQSATGWVTYGTVPTVSNPTTDNTRRILACGSGWYLLHCELPLNIPTADGLLKGRTGRHTDQDGCPIIYWSTRHDVHAISSSEPKRSWF